MPESASVIMTQLSLKAGMKCLKVKGRSAAKSDMKQLHFRYTFKPNQYRDINEDQKKIILDSRIFLKEKRDGTIKGTNLAGGNKKRYFISKQDSSSMTVSTEAVLFSCIIDAEEKRGVAVIDIPN